MAKKSNMQGTNNTTNCHHQGAQSKAGQTDKSSTSSKADNSSAKG